jgi:hypothetical protein
MYSFLMILILFISLITTKYDEIAIHTIGLNVLHLLMFNAYYNNIILNKQFNKVRIVK